MAGRSALDCENAPIRPRIRTILAPNPSMMTQNGTNTYILGSGQVALIDPGPALKDHETAIHAALEPGESISHIFVTHAHLDHSALASDLAKATGAPIFGFGTATAGRSDRMQRLAAGMDIGGGEGVDHAFQPDEILADGQTVTGPTWAIEAIHTPGHMGNHLCFAAGDILFSGDHVMGWSTSLISPPDGDMTDYMASLRKLAARPFATFLPGHGPAIASPTERIAELIAHRMAREAALLVAIAAGPTTIPTLAGTVYPALAVALLPAAHRNILAHLIDLESKNLVLAIPRPRLDAMFMAV